MAGMGWKQGGALVLGGVGGTYIGGMLANKIAKPTDGARTRIAYSAGLQLAGGFLLMTKGRMPNVGGGMMASGGVSGAIYFLTAGAAGKQGGDALLNGAAAILGLPSTDAATTAANAQIAALPAATPAPAGTGTQTGTPQAYTMARL